MSTEPWASSTAGDVKFSDAISWIVVFWRSTSRRMMSATAGVGGFQRVEAVGHGRSPGLVRFGRAGTLAAYRVAPASDSDRAPRTCLAPPGSQRGPAPTAEGLRVSSGPAVPPSSGRTRR